MTNSTPKITKIIALTAALAVTGLTALPASAGSGETVTVKFDRAELATEPGAKRVYAKLERAAEKACGKNDGMLDLARRMAEKNCTATMLEGFVRQVNSSRMSAIYAAEKHQLGKA